MTSFKQWNSGDILTASDQNADLVKCPVGGNYKVITGRTTWSITTSNIFGSSGLTISWGYTFSLFIGATLGLECTGAGFQRWVLTWFGSPGASNGTIQLSSADGTAQTQSGRIHWSVWGT